MEVFYFVFSKYFQKVFNRWKILFPKYVPKLLLLTDDTFQYPAGTT